MAPCLKQLTRCVIIVDGQAFEATNDCNVGDATVCPRVTAGCETGEGYELCGPPIHAEVAAAKLVLEHFGEPVRGGTAFIYGHDYLCRDCQHALTAAGVRRFVVTGEDA